MYWLQTLFRRKANEQKLDAELRFHLEQQTRENIAGGIEPEEARRKAAIEFGGLEQIRERCRELQPGRWLETTLQDLRFGFRSLCRSPGFTVAALTTIGIGIGANAAIFSFVDAVFLKPSPYPDADRIVMLSERSPQGERQRTSTPTYIDWTKQNTVFDKMAAQNGGGDEVALTGIDIPADLYEAKVTADYFSIFRVRPALGRTFLPGEDQSGRDNVVMLSNKLWVSQFGSDANVIGRTIMLDGKPNIIIGVMPPRAIDEYGFQLFRPLAFAPESARSREGHWLEVFALLKPGVTVDQAGMEMKTIGTRIARAYPKSNKGWGILTTLYTTTVVWKDLRQSLYLLMAAVGMMLLIACANLANLVLARGLVRGREVAIRAALGAGRLRLVRQFLTESLLLSSAGGLLGLLIAYGCMAILKKAPPGGGLPLTADVALDGRVLLFTVGLSLLTGLVFGLPPAVRASRLDLAHAFKDSSAATSPSRHLRGLSGALVVTEVALAFVLLSGAGLLIRSFFEVQKADIGFDSTNLAEAYLPLGRRFSSSNELKLYLHQIVDRIGALPGVQSVALTTSPPIRGGWGYGMQFQIAGTRGTDLAHRPFCGFKVVTPSYFHTLGMRLVKGRLLNDHDGTGASPVTVISESMAKKYFPSGDAVGRYVLIQELAYDLPPRGPEIPWEVVGVVKDEKNGQLRDENSPGIYVTEDQSPQTWQFLIVRGAVDPAILDRSMRVALRGVNGDQVLDRLVTLEEVKSQSLASARRRSWLMAFFAVVALLLAGMGLYGVISYSVAQRTHEIGIRTALGATSASILGLVLRSGVMLTSLGLIIGAAGALGLSQFLSSMLFNIGKYDPATLAAVSGVLFSAAVLACYIPARRATNVDPLVALRCE